MNPSFLSRLVPHRGPGRVLRHLVHGDQAIFLDYPVRFAPRYGYGAPPHPELYRLVDRSREDYARFLSSCRNLGGALAAIPARAAEGSAEPSWINDFLSGLDGAALYASLSRTRISPSSHRFARGTFSSSTARTGAS